MGTPRDHKGARIEVRISTHEMRAWRKHAKTSGQSFSAMVRRAVNGVVPSATTLSRKHLLPQAARREPRQRPQRMIKPKRGA